MKTPNVHDNLLWDLTILFAVLTIAYLTTIYITNKLRTKSDNNINSRSQIMAIVCQLLLYGQSKSDEYSGFCKDLKVSLWKLLRVPGNKVILSEILLKLDADLADTSRERIYSLYKEFKLHIEAFEQAQAKGHNTSNKAMPRKWTSTVEDKQEDLETTMKDPQDNMPKDKYPSNFVGDEVIEMNFIPLVTQNQEMADEATKAFHEALLINCDLDFLMQCLRAQNKEPDPYEEVYNTLIDKIVDSPNEGKDIVESSFLNIDFLPMIMDAENSEAEETESMVDINDLDVDYEVVIDPHLKSQITQILESHTREQLQDEVLFDKETNILDLGEMDIPAAKFYTDWEYKKVKLLQSIVEMGDIREVPLLNEMLDEEENESISVLIKEIIHRFLSEYPMVIDEDYIDSTKVKIGDHYVLNHFFHAVDTESQLILLEEIMQVGGLNEYYFLETLIDYPEKSVADKAKIVSEVLKMKLELSYQDGTEEGTGLFANQDLDLNSSVRDGAIFSPKTQKTLSFSSYGCASVQDNNAMPVSEAAHPFKEKHNSVLSTGQEDTGSIDIFNIDFELSRSSVGHDQETSRVEDNEGKKDSEDLNFLGHLKDLGHKFLKNK
ncbi:hypothetical protein EHW67_17345 [Arenibacter aquaticus]|uniref:Uncharacterized protein n=1 Tax=Arenibacter aquaticus TaxID=2489054 RepID=A0A3S0AWM2_9FLAO|nr:hypothetical protein [Arenibacter aquaticus]RTE51967.1 hypothetical protein EHW67_17345 [Arenibacter aquaticus]